MSDVVSFSLNVVCFSVVNVHVTLCTSPTPRRRRRSQILFLVNVNFANDTIEIIYVSNLLSTQCLSVCLSLSLLFCSFIVPYLCARLSSSHFVLGVSVYLISLCYHGLFIHLGSLFVHSPVHSLYLCHRKFIHLLSYL